MHFAAPSVGRYDPYEPSIGKLAICGLALCVRVAKSSCMGPESSNQFGLLARNNR
jgi:hypothetical protein